MRKYLLILALLPSIAHGQALNMIDCIMNGTVTTCLKPVNVASGGTGLTTGTSGGVPYFSSSSAMTSSGALTQYGIIYGGGAGAAPVATAAGLKGQALRAGSTTPAFDWTPFFTLGTGDYTANNYTITDTDGIEVVSATTGNTNRTITLPTAGDNTKRVLTIKKADSGTGSLTIDGEGGEAIDGQATVVLYFQYGFITIICDGVGWEILNGPIENGTYTATVTGVANNQTGPSLDGSRFSRVGKTVTVSGSFDMNSNVCDGTVASKVGISLPLPSNFTTADQLSGSAIPESATMQKGGFVLSDPTNDRAEAWWYPTSDPGNDTISFIFHYTAL